MRPDFVALEQAARRERAEAVHRLLVKPLIDLFRPAPRSHRHPQATHSRAAA